MSIMLIIFLVDMGLVYGLTYCVGVITRSGSRALIGSAILFFGYQILREILRARFHIEWPAFLLSYQNMHHRLEIPAIHSFVIRACLALAFPALTQLVLDKMEI